MNTSKPAIYVLTNTTNGAIYVGGTANFAKRAYNHMWSMKNNRHSNRHIQAAFNDGAVFTIAVLELLDDASSKYEREQYYMDKLQPYYNIEPRAGTPTGVIRTPEQRANYAASMIGNTNCVGRVLSAQTRELIRQGGAATRARKTEEKEMTNAQ